MKKLFVRLAASGAIVASLGAPALAGNTSIHTTGPDSTNTVTSTNHTSWNQINYNRVGLDNRNHQQAGSGNVCACGNTWVGGSPRSGDAYNLGTTSNAVSVSNSGDLRGFTSPSGGHVAGIHLTGPDSYNAIRSSNHSEYNQRNYNHIGITNHNHQSASSGNVSLSRNTMVHSDGSSGNATNVNQTHNNVSVSNSSPSFSLGSNSGHHTASIGTTGPGSYNSVKFNDRSETNAVAHNSIGISNSNHQSAESGDVSISRNTAVHGGGSGDAANANNTQNHISLNN